MPNNYVVDTHALIWYLAGDPRLSERTKAVLQNPHGILHIPVIVLCEIAWIISKGRCKLTSFNDVLKAIDEDPALQIIPLTRHISKIASELNGCSDIHDALIVATARALSIEGSPATLITADRTIATLGHVSTIW